MNLEDVPSTLPTHLELQKTRVFCNLDAPQHVTIYLSIFSFSFFFCYSSILFSHVPLNFNFNFFFIIYFHGFEYPFQESF